jgi:hypothetical protein
MAPGSGLPAANCGGETPSVGGFIGGACRCVGEEGGEDNSLFCCGCASGDAGVTEGPIACAAALAMAKDFGGAAAT